MSVREIVIRIKLPESRRWAYGVAAALVLSAGVAYAAVTWPATYASGQVVSASDLKDRLNDLNTRINAFSTATTWTNLTLKNSWVPYSAAWPAPSYTKTADGMVHLRGLAAQGTATGSTLLATLPAGYRPSQLRMFAVSGRGDCGAANIDVGTNGDLTLDTTLCANSQLSFEGISFFAEQ